MTKNPARPGRMHEPHLAVRRHVDMGHRCKLDRATTTLKPVEPRPGTHDTLHRVPLNRHPRPRVRDDLHHHDASPRLGMCAVDHVLVGAVISPEIADLMPARISKRTTGSLNMSRTNTSASAPASSLTIPCCTSIVAAPPT